MTDDGAPAAPPAAVRRVDSAAAARLVELVETFEELQMVLRCCERLVAELADDGTEPEAVVVDAVWTLALAAYGRCFADRGDAPVLTPEDLSSVHSSAEVLEWHRVLLQLRDQYADPVDNPRERFTVGVAQDESGAPTGIAITSARRPLVDDLTVRQTGAITYALTPLVNRRIEAQQAVVFEEVKDTPPADLEKLARLDLEQD